MQCVFCGSLLARNNRKDNHEHTELSSGWHLKNGDLLPPYKGGLRLFAMRFCQYVQRTLLVLRAKNIPYDIVYVDLKHKPEWIYDYSPKGTVPALEYERGKALFDSTVINVYLDEVYPKPRLQSTNPIRRAQDKLLLENFTAVQSVYYTAGFNPQAVEPTHVETYHSGLERLQKELIDRGTKFLHGDQPGLVDYSVWPFLERFEALPLLGCSNEQFELSRVRYERLLKNIEAMKLHPVVKFSYLAPETHAKYLKTRINGDPDFNMLVPVSSL
ncbi:pyrimidodiazepine synthase [Phthorimaea operculella]|nr:pyrimidodiazepine synthase [Phthorimaea operculella]